MNYYLTKIRFTSQESAIITHGDSIWDDICDYMPIDKPFTINDFVAKKPPSLNAFSPVTSRMYVSAVLHNVVAESPENPAIEQVGKQKWKFRATPDSSGADQKSLEQF